MFRFLCGLTYLGVPEIAELAGTSPERRQRLLGARRAVSYLDILPTLATYFK